MTQKVFNPVFLEETTAAQQVAARADRSAWVAASAGSGKTKVLIDRVLHLLLSGNRPERLLCLTFTKSAAAEMSNRVMKELKKWAVADDADLTQKITLLQGRAPTADLLTSARALLAETLDTPGGLKIMTIHSFCQSVLKRFPLEAGVAPHFEVLDDIRSADLMAKAREKALALPALAPLVARLACLLDNKGLEKNLKTCLDKRRALTKALQRAGSIGALETQIRASLGLKAEQTPEEIIRAAGFDPSDWDRLLATYLSDSLKFIYKKFIDDPTAQRVFETLHRVRALETVENTLALLIVSYKVLEEYAEVKRRGGWLDYDDLIDKTLSLLDGADMAAWVLYKLDGGLDHILVDEAQDTNPNQWRIVRKLAEEFFAGEGAADDRERTVFAVGDKKQSIYSFQGADPDEFERMHRFFETKARAAQKKFETVPLNTSFRSVTPVLDLVNLLLTDKEAAFGVLDATESAPHRSIFSNGAGRVEIWPLEEAEKTDAADPWLPPVERKKGSSAVTRLATKIADKISHMIQSGEILESEGRPVRPGDFLILVQRRHKLAKEIIRLLMERRVPVAGLDRLILTDHAAVIDLIALLRFVLLPQDDLNLAVLLKSPLVNLSEEELFSVAYNRGQASVFERLKSLFPAAHNRLLELMQKADTMPVFEFFSYVLGPFGGRAAFVARLGEEALEALDEFLNLTLVFEQSGAVSLEAFLSWISRQKIEIKRDLDTSEPNAVRLMTIHASKGLQGQIVFVPDTIFVPQERESLVFSPDGVPLWFARAELKVPAVQGIFDAADDARLKEYRRLLYVALTRAQTRLYVTGAANKTKSNPACWYELIDRTLKRAPAMPASFRGLSADQILVFEQTAEGVTSEAPSRPAAPPAVTLPDWALTPAPQEPSPPRPLAPSQSEPDGQPADSLRTKDQISALRRGTFIHKLLHHLPQVPPAERARVAKRLAPPDMEIPEKLFTLLEEPAFQKLFSPTALSEVPVAGVLNGRLISGQIDRFYLDENTLFLADFKTNRRVPKTPREVPAAYKKQLSAYKALLKEIFPAKMVKTFLLWTETLTLMEITDED